MVHAKPVKSTRADLYDGFAIIGKALAAGRRLEILDLLNQAPRSVGQLAAEIDQSMANTSHHLQLLMHAGLLTSRRDSHQIIYALRRPEVGQLLSMLRDLAVDEVAEVGELAMAHLGDRRHIGSISVKELARLRRLGRVVVIDVRPRQDYDADHIEGARWVPLEAVSEFAETLPADSEVVAYCRNDYCSFADAAVRELRRLGVRARRLEEGFPQWVLRGGVRERSA
jgi:rhodanese-related sulfurtransferase